jgi:hypothetical protein
MRTLSDCEIESVSGGWTWEVDIGIFKMQGTGAELYSFYDWTVNQTTVFFTWWDPAGYYN